MQQPLTPEERQRMVSLVSSGHSIRETARLTGRSTWSVSTTVRDEGIAPSNVWRDNRVLADGRDRWNLRRRAQLVAAGFDKAEELLPTVTKTRDLQSWAVSTGILIDKMRLESDLSTANVEQHTHLTMEQAQAIRELLLRS